jgi:hypothetical protein
MTKIQNRREFIGAACGAGCLALCASGLRAETPSGEGEKKKHDFAKLTYCCFECREDRCPLLKATLSNEVELKQREAAKWRERYGREFAADEVFCYGCKVEPAKQAYNTKACDVRACVIKKGLVSCAHCRELVECQRKLWVNYPKFREAVLAIQKDVLG